MDVRENWGTLGARARTAAVAMALASVLNLIFGLVFIEAVEEAFDALSSFLPFDMEVFLVVWAIVFTLLDLLVAFGVVNHKNWARSLGIWWGIWGVVQIVLSAGSPSPMFAVYGLYIVSAVCLLLTKKRPRGKQEDAA